jgi:dihydroflavonol-4-reductase
MVPMGNSYSSESRLAFVTGATGFVGGSLVSLLLSEGWRIRALVRSKERASTLTGRGVELVEGDLSASVSQLQSWMEGADVVFHLAALYRFGVWNTDAMVETNVEGTRRILQGAEAAGVARLVHCSTIGCYGDSSGSIRNESHYDPASVAALPYTATKRAAHELVQQAAAKGMDAVIVSPTGIFGAGDSSIIGRFVDFAVRGWLKVGVYKESRMGFVHVDDVSAGLLAAYQQGKSGRDYILVARTASLGEVLTEVAQLAGRSAPWWWLPPWMVRLSVPFSPLVALVLGQGPLVLRDSVAMLDGVHLDYDGSRARQELSWQPAPFAQRMQETLADWRR